MENIHKQFTNTYDDNALESIQPTARRFGYSVFALHDYHQFINIINSGLFKAGDFVFRGQSDMNAPLASSLARCLEGLLPDERTKVRKEHYQNFIRYSRGRINSGFQNPLGIPPGILHAIRNSESMASHPLIWALGQHYGLGTPLLDWTRKPLVALYFAFEPLRNPGASRAYRVIYALNRRTVQPYSEYAAGDEDVYIYEADELCDTRLLSQHGLFTYSTQEAPLERWAMHEARGENPALIKFLIPEVDRDRCLGYLDNMAGINRHLLFPDLSGAANYCMQIMRSRPREQRIIANGHKTIGTKAPDAQRQLVVDHLRNVVVSEGRTLNINFVSGIETFNEIKEYDGAQGGFSFIGTDANNNKFFIKIPDITKIETVDGEYNYVTKEHDILNEINELPGIPKAVRAGFVKIAESMFTAPALVSEFIEGSRLDHILAAAEIQDKIDHKWLIELGIRLCSILESLHNKRIVHSFISPRYVIFPGWTVNEDELPDPKNAHLVGFGYAGFWREGGPFRQLPAVDQMFAPPERRDNYFHLGGSSFHSDIYSLGALLFACGTTACLIPEGDNEAILERANWREQVSLLFLKSVIAKCINTYPASRYSAVERLKEDLFVAQKLSVVDPQLALPSLDQHHSLRPRRAKGKSPEYLINIVKTVQHKLGIASESERGSFEVFGHRERLLQFMCTLFASLPHGSEYRTITHARYWTGSNLGVYGRFFTLNCDLTHASKLMVKRLFLTSDELLDMSIEEQYVLQRHARYSKSSGHSLTTRVLKVG